MPRKPRPASARSYAVGYGRPPDHSRFRPGISGNPRGRPAGRRRKSFDAMILEEAHRLINVVEGGKEDRIPLLQAIVRKSFLRAAKDSAAAAKLTLQLAAAAEASMAARDPGADDVAASQPEVSDIDFARRLAFLLAKGAAEGKKRDEPVGG